MTAPLLELKGLSVGYRRGREERRVAGPFSLALREGRLTALVGRNGIGKSTLLRTLCRLQPPLGGEMFLRGRPLSEWHRGEFARWVSAVLSEREIAPDMTVFDLVALGRHPHTDWRGRLRREDRAAVEDALSVLRMSHFRNRSLFELSDGERQRAFTARALAQEPELLLLDEPTAFLDLLHKVETVTLLRDLCRTRRMTVLVAIHDISVAVHFADHLWLLADEGTLLEGAPEDLVLSGALGRLFSSETLRFDPFSGRFFPFGGVRFRAVLEVKGEGEARICAESALERCGFGIARGDALREGTLEVLPESAGNGRFLLRPQGGRERCVASIADLSEELDRLFPLIPAGTPREPAPVPSGRD